MDWKSIAVDVSKAAPILGGLLGGPLGAAGGSLVTKMVSSALGVPDDSDSVASALATDPTALEKLKEVESNNAVALQQLAVTQEQNRLLASNAQYSAEAADRDSARVLAAKQPNDYMRPLLALSIVALTGYTVVVVMSGKPSGWNETVIALVSTMIGYIISELKSVFGFYFGMTKDAQAQGQAITAFATSPGSVTAQPAAPVVVNNAASTQNVETQGN